MNFPAWLPRGMRPLTEVPLTSTMGNRSPARLAFVVAQFLLEVAPRYERRDVTGDAVPETFCNFAARDVCFALGTPLPEGLRANELHDWLVLQSRQPGAPGWEAVPAHVAQRAADEGMVALAVWRNPLGPGHVAVLVPSLDEPGLWIAQAGRENFTRDSLERGFGKLQPDFFVHP